MPWFWKFISSLSTRSRCTFLSKSVVVAFINVDNGDGRLSEPWLDIGAPPCTFCNSCGSLICLFWNTVCNLCCLFSNLISSFIFGNNPLVFVTYLSLLTPNTPRVRAEFVAEVLSFLFRALRNVCRFRNLWTRNGVALVSCRWGLLLLRAPCQSSRNRCVSFPKWWLSRLSVICVFYIVLITLLFRACPLWLRQTEVVMRQNIFNWFAMRSNCGIRAWYCLIHLFICTLINPGQTRRWRSGGTAEGL
jgi:hypothetical protein